jgi:hypothetical protein
MSDVINLTAKRNERENPDPEFVRKDDFGRPMYCYALDYAMDDASWGAQIWAYSMEDAERRVEAMRSSLSLLGQMYCVVPG